MQRFKRTALSTALACGLLLPFGGAALSADGHRPTPQDLAVPRYSHIFVIVEENKGHGDIMGNANAPTINALAKTYGNATHFDAETHPSEPNYVAMIGGSTYGIRDDDAYYCKPHVKRASCHDTDDAGYPNHTIDRPNLGTQLVDARLTWKNYNESLPAPGSLAVVATDPHAPGISSHVPVYASKHSGFINFASVQNDPKRAEHLVGFDQLSRDLKSGNVPNFAFVIPNLCNEMHGAGPLSGAPWDCSYLNTSKLIARGDAHVKSIVAEIMGSSVWKSTANAAIVITFDEDEDRGKEACCGNDPADPANSGGGRIPTVVITNHGPRGAVDSTPYSHYALLRTIEDAFGIHTYLERASAPGVVPMLPLFETRKR